MWAVVAIIAGIIGLAAILLRRLHHYLTSNKSHKYKPQSKDKKQNRDNSEPQPKASFRERKGLSHNLTSDNSQKQKPQLQNKNQNKEGCTEQGTMMSNSDDVLDEFNTMRKWLKDHSHEIEGIRVVQHGYMSNSNASDALEWRRPILRNVMDALDDPNIHLIGLYGSHDEIKDGLLEKVCRRVHRDKLFDMVLTASVTKKLDLKKIQEEIAQQLGLTFHHKSKDERAQELIKRIKLEQKILIILCDLHKGFGLGKIGIPFGADHSGCKILLTSTSEDVLSNHMHTQINFNIDF